MKKGLLAIFSITMLLVACQNLPENSLGSSSTSVGEVSLPDSSSNGWGVQF